MEKKKQEYGWDILYPEEKDDKKYTPKPRRPKYDNDVDNLRKLLKKLSHGLGSNSGSKTKGTFDKNHVAEKRNVNGSDFRNKQRCMIKVNYGNSKGSHLKFLNRYMPQKNKETVKTKPKLFGNISEAEYKRKATSRHFKFIISPERVMDSSQLEIFIRSYVDKMERRTGRKYDWQAAVHNDTPHPHVHLVINGVDRDGKDIRFSKDYIRNIARHDAEDFLTGMYGERTKEEIAIAENLALTSARWTNIDEKILLLLGDNLTIKDKHLTPNIERRLSYLQSLNLASWNNGTWKLSKNYKETLVTSGRYNMFLDAHFFVNPDCAIHLYKSEMGVVSGKIRHFYKMDDEGVWTNAVVIENKELKQAWYVPVYSTESFNSFKEGDNITIKCRANASGKLSPKLFHNSSSKTKNTYDI